MKHYPNLLSHDKCFRKKINDGILEEGTVLGSGEYEGYEGALWWEKKS